MCRNNKGLSVYGDDMQIRDWLYEEDHCKASNVVAVFCKYFLEKGIFIMQQIVVATNGKIGEVYNVDGHSERPNIFIVKTIIE